jgi:hypothetical protein
MSINELPMKAAPRSGGILERIAMHGVDQSQPPKQVAGNSDMVIHLGPGGKVLGVGAKGGTRKPKGTIQSIPAHPDLDLDNLPEHMEMSDDGD